MNRFEVNIFDLISKQALLSILLGFLAGTVLLSIIFIEVDAFEWLYDYSRLHEDIELDEFILVAFSFLLFLSLSTIALTIVLGKRLLALARKEMQLELQLMHSAKLQAMGNMLGGVAHSMNNYLQPIKTLTLLTIKNLPKDSEEAKDLDKVITATDNAIKTLRKVLHFSHIESSKDQGKPQPISETVSAVTDLASATIPNFIEFNHNIPQMGNSVVVSSLDIEIVLLNLISNAIDAIETKPGKIDISLYESHIPETLQRPTNCETTTCACIKVSDNGKGIKQEQLEYIFNPFYTDKPVGKGTGLGLSETLGIIENAKGAINIDSTPGKGTSVYLYIPMKKT